MRNMAIGFIGGGLGGLFILLLATALNSAFPTKPDELLQLFRFPTIYLFGSLPGLISVITQIGRQKPLAISAVFGSIGMTIAWILSAQIPH